MTDDPAYIPYSATEVEILAAEYGDKLVTTLTRWGLRPAQAQEVAQQAFFELIKTWQQRPLDAPERKLFSVAKLRVVDEWRRQDRKPLNLLDPENLKRTAEAMLSVPSFDVGLFARRDVETALRDLPVRQQHVLVMRYWLDLEIGIVAELLGCTTNDVKNATKRGLKKLRSSPQLNGYASKLPGVTQ